MITAPLLLLVARTQLREMRHGLPPLTMALTYHDVIQRRGPGSVWFDCTTDELKGQLDWLARQGGHFVSVSQLYRHLTEALPLPSNPVVVTFADNYEGFYLRAWPILRSRHIPVAMFVHTGFIGAQNGRPKMSWTQLRELDRSGLVTIGSQTVSHPADLRQLDDAPLATEMLASKRTLEAGLGHRVSSLAYPNGKFDARVARFARKAGYLMAFTEQLRPAERSDGIFYVCRYVHTKWRQAWRDSHRSRPPR